MSRRRPDRKVNAELEKQVAQLQADNAQLHRQMTEMANWEKTAWSRNEELSESLKAGAAERKELRELVSSLLTGSGYGNAAWPQLELSEAALKAPSVLLATVHYLTALQTFDSISKWHTDRTSIESAAFVVGLRAYGLVHATNGSDEDKKVFLSSVIDWLAAHVKYVEFSHSGLETRFDAERHLRLGPGTKDHVTPLSLLVRDRSSDHFIFKAWVK